MKNNMITNKDFVHLHCHTDRGSNIRMKDSVVKVEDLIQYANKIGNKGVSITDHECLSSHVLGINTVNQLKKEGKIDKDFKLLLGNEIYLVDLNKLRETRVNKEKITFFHCILIAKDEIGHRQIRELSSIAWEYNFFSYYGMQRVPTGYSDIEKVIGKEKGHLIMSTACLGSLLGSLSIQLMNEENINNQNKIKDKMSDFIEWALDIFNEDFYLEMQPNTSKEQIFYNKLLTNIAEAYKIPLIISTDIHYLDEKHKQVHKAFLTSDEKDSNREVDDFYETTRFFNVDEIFFNMEYIDKGIIERAIMNTKRIMDSCEVGENNDYGLFKPTKIPLTPLPNKEKWYEFNTDIIKSYKYIDKIYNDEYVYHTYLIHEIFRGIKNRGVLNNDLSEYLARVNVELEEIYELSKVMKEPIGAYITTMQANLDKIWETSIVGVGRGSSVCYVIDYLVGITDIDPLRQGNMTLPHWRFIHKSKIEMPDIDSDYNANLKNKVFYKQRQFYKNFQGDVVRVSTFKTETSKSAIKTACRGLRINSDESQYISSLVKVERGKVWSIKDMYYGNKEKEREPVQEFVNLIDKHKDVDLLNTILSVEGLISGVGSHASGVIPINENIVNYSSVMRTPSGELITSFDLHEIEKCGVLKYDYLLTNGMTIIQTTLNLLMEHGYIEKQKTLRETYNKYLLPKKIGSENKKVWDNICNNKVINLFQFGDTPVGREAIKKLQPRNIVELANANALMRLMSKGSKEQPIDKYIRFKNNPMLWEQEMTDFGLNEEDRETMHELLDDQYGVCSNQESMMEMFMHPKVANYSVKEVNIIKKAIAKKQENLLKEAESLLYKRQKEIKTSKRLLDYCWEVQTGYQKGYSFSKPHCIAYSWIGYQEAYLYTEYPSVFWYTANLLSISDGLDDEEDDDITYDFETKEKSTKYGKIATAISKVQNEGIKVTPPYINEAEQGFKPNERDRVIVFGLKGITGINNETVKIITENKPFKSLKDFHDRMVNVKRPKLLKTGKTQMKSLVSSTQTITLIKAGAFDKIENKTREEILEDYLKILNPPKNKLNSKDISKISELGILPSEYKDIIRYYNFREFIMQLPKIKDKDSKSIEWLKIDCCEDTEYTTNFFLDNFSNEMTENVDYKYDEEGFLYVAIKTKRKGSFEYLYNEKIRPILEWLSTEDCISFYNSIRFNNIKNENMKGNISSWEMESMNYYYHEHELVQGNLSKYNIKNFNELPTEPEIIDYTKYKNIQYPKYDLYNIAGTVLDRDKNKHLVTLLTIEGVVTVKFYSGQFSFYDKNISMDTGIDEKTGKNKKVTLEEGWFKRGNLLLVTGFRREDNFFPKRYKNSVVQHTVQLIKEIKPNGDLILQSERVNIDN